MLDLSTYLYLFVSFALAGWLLEFLYRSLQAKRIINPGFLKGPYLLLYGTSAVILTFCITGIHGHDFLFHALILIRSVSFLEVGPLDVIVLKGLALASKGILYFFVTTGIELLTGLFFARLLRRPLWDYSGEALCIKKSVCLKYSCYWVILAFFFEYALLPLSLLSYRLFDPLLMSALTVTISWIMLVDWLYQIALIAKACERQRIARKERNLREFNEILESLLETAEVRHLADFKHHRDKSRLEHSLEVAWLSYTLTRRLSLDSRAAARGGLLHDLFFYDWLTEGPRLHGLRHPRISLENALKITPLNMREQDIIKKHMWPLTFLPPRYPESWIVCFADTYCGIKDYLLILKHVYQG